jgi:RNA polymerase sigma factor (sigma-70 family)
LEVSFLSDLSIEDESGDTAGDHFTKQEKDEITNRLMPLIVKIAGETSKTNKALEYDEVFGACMEGFVKALNKYTKRNIPVAFSCYSVNCMKFAVVDTTRRNTKKSRPVIGVYLDEEVDEETKHDSYSYITTDENANIIEKSVKKVQFDELLKNAGPELNPLERKFLFYYYLSGEGLTIMEVAEKMRKKKSEIISIQTSALSKLRNVANNMGYANLTDFIA